MAHAQPSATFSESHGRHCVINGDRKPDGVPVMGFEVGADNAPGPRHLSVEEGAGELGAR